MVHRGQKFLQNIGKPDFQTGCIDAGVAADVFVLQEVFVNEQLHPVPMVVHQPKNTDGARVDVQQLRHMFFVRKGQPGAAQLGGERFRAEFFCVGHQKQVKNRLLPVAEKQIFAHPGAECFVHILAGFHSHGGDVIYAGIGNFYFIQKSVGSKFPFLPGAGERIVFHKQTTL